MRSLPLSAGHQHSPPARTSKSGSSMSSSAMVVPAVDASISSHQSGHRLLHRQHSSTRSLHRPASSSNGNGNGVVTTQELATQRQLRQAAPAGPVDEEAQEVCGYSPDQVFCCPEESLFYSQCLQKVLRGGADASFAAPGSRERSRSVVVEFGAGDGTPVIDALLKTGRRFEGVVHGFELNPRAARVAADRAATMSLSDRYQVHSSCFFKGAEALREEADWLVANPPYLPAPDNQLLMPELHGGLDGSELTNALLSLGFPNAMLLVSSYSNPVGTIEHARQCGYSVTDFLVTPLPFGYYSSEPKVKDWIKGMKSEGTAFYSERGASEWYLLAGVLFQKAAPGIPAYHPVPSTNLATAALAAGTGNGGSKGQGDGKGSNGGVTLAASTVPADAGDEVLRVLTALR